MATSYLMTGKHIPHFGLNSLISTLSFSEIFSYFATSWKWYCLPFRIAKKSGFLRRFFQYSVNCHISKYIKLPLTDFHKNKIYYRKCMWLQLRQVLTNSPKEMQENLPSVLIIALICWRHKNQKTLMFSFEHAAE